MHKKTTKNQKIEFRGREIFFVSGELNFAEDPLTNEISDNLFQQNLVTLVRKNIRMVAVLHYNCSPNCDDS